MTADRTREIRDRLAKGTRGPWEHWVKDMHGTIEARYQEDGLDEVIAHNATVHMERMSEGAFWIGIEDANGMMIHVWILSTSRRAHVEAMISMAEQMPPRKARE